MGRQLSESTVVEKLERAIYAVLLTVGVDGHLSVSVKGNTEYALCPDGDRMRSELKKAICGVLIKHVRFLNMDDELLAELKALRKILRSEHVEGE